MQGLDHQQYDPWAPLCSEVSGKESQFGSARRTLAPISIGSFKAPYEFRVYRVFLRVLEDLKASL